jgi:hypothetical protein
MSPGEFKEIVRRTFNLKLLSREVGAIFAFFNNKDGDADMDHIDCREFLRYFIQLGITERAKVKSEQLEVIKSFELLNFFNSFMCIISVKERKIETEKKSTKRRFCH